MTHNDPLNGKKISDVLKELPVHFTTPDISIGALKDALPGRIYGILLLVLAVPNFIPIPAPGLSAILGLPLVVISFQLMLGRKTPWFPKFIARRTIKRDHLQRICTRIAPYLAKLERIIKPRLKFLVKPPADRVIACLCVVLSLMIMMPVPLGNALPALAIFFFAMGILQRDGLLVILGILIAIIAGIVISAFVGGIFLSVPEIFDP